MEKIKDCNEYIRNVAKNIHKRITQHAEYIHNIKDKHIQDALFLDSIQSNEYEDQLFAQFFNISQESITKTNIVTTMIKYQLFIEYYKELTLAESKGTISSIAENDLERLRNANSPEEIVELTSRLDTHIPFSMLNALCNYSSLSVFEKILQIKALAIEDFEKLTSISPFFEIEENKYDIDVSLAFIKNRINMLNSGSFKNDNERTYNETVDFIYNLGKLRKEETKRLLDEIVVESSDIMISITQNSTEDMKCSYGYISKEQLKLALKDMTKKDENPIKEKK